MAHTSAVADDALSDLSHSSASKNASCDASRHIKKSACMTLRVKKCTLQVGATLRQVNATCKERTRLYHDIKQTVQDTLLSAVFRVRRLSTSHVCHSGRRSLSDSVCPTTAPQLTIRSSHPSSLSEGPAVAQHNHEIVARQGGGGVQHHWQQRNESQEGTITPGQRVKLSRRRQRVMGKQY